jgi:acid phosphatase family membrane protein YuiD
VIKTIIHFAMTKKFEWERLVGDGGMPSGHSATVTSLAMMCALVYGTGSFEFAVTCILAIIVCHDATGVRLETGKQAVVINELRKTLHILTEKAEPEEKLKEFVGHTPIQVAAGILIGILNAIFMYHVLF